MENDAYTDVVIPAYVINLADRTDRKASIQEQFKNKPEFQVTFVNACKHPIGARGLWLSFLKVIQLAKTKEDDLIVICEDDHVFTESYSKRFFFDNVLSAFDNGANILLGGVSGFKHAVLISENLYWIDAFYGTQFVVLHRKIFDLILTEPYDDLVTADGKFSELTSHKMLIYPFISVQKDFGYSDVFPFKSRDRNYLEIRFNKAESQLEKIRQVCKAFRKTGRPNE